MKTIHWLVLIMLLGVLGAGCKQDVTPQLSLEPTIVPTIPLLDVTNLIAGRAPSYRGITPGVSRKSDVLAQWGSPNVIRTYKEYESLHYFGRGPKEYIQFEERFLLKNDIVQAVTSDAMRSQLQDDYLAILDDWSRTLETPQVITPTLGDPIWVFSNHGLAVSDSVYQFFEPMGVQEYQALWGKLPLEYDPFPLIPSIEVVGIKPGQTMRSQVAQLLGDPDRIIYQDHGAPWLYDVEPDMLGRLHIFFSSDDRVEYMDIAPFHWVPKPVLLEDTVRQYGRPDMLQLIPSFEEEKYASLALLYLNQGLRIGTGCVKSKCNIVKRDAVVEQKWYFQPQTLAEYKARFASRDPAHEPAYIEWHGFDE